MKNFKRKSIHLALAAGIGASSMAIAGGPGDGMYINADGTGQVLLYPYYTTRGGMDTYMSVINTTGYAKAVKVRFIESLNSREVLDFNLYLSPYDMWTAGVVNTSTGAKMITSDKSCTTPMIPAGGVAFKNDAYNGLVTDKQKVDPDNSEADGINIGGVDGETTSLDRTREGYIEIIEMGEIGDDHHHGDDDFAFYVTHNDQGVPNDCSKLQKLKNADKSKLHLLTPSGGLTGTASLVAPGSGTDFSYDPVAIDNFAWHEIWHEPGSIDPDLRHGRDRSLVFYKEQVVDTSWLGTGEYGTNGMTKDSVNAVNALLMHRAVINEFVLDNHTLSGTDWVVTMPTKRYSVPVKDPQNNNHNSRHALQPFTSTFWEGGACEPVEMEYYNREELTREAGFSPPPASGNQLCWEANVITFNDSNILSSANSVNVAIDEGFQNGWLRMHFDAENNILESDESNHTYQGLPVIGFMVQDFVNMGAAPGVMATYGGSFKHKYETCIDGSGIYSNCHGDK